MTLSPGIARPLPMTLFEERQEVLYVHSTDRKTEAQRHRDLQEMLSRACWAWGWSPGLSPSTVMKEGACTWGAPQLLCSGSADIGAG